jgi:nicotinate-nucleotide adenylyltransferase
VSVLGLVGGTFDPVHAGHLDVARAARRALSLDRVLLMPSRVPPHRSAPHASAAHRFAMVALAIQDQDGLEVSDLELQDDGPSYTSRTLDRLDAVGIDTGSLCFVIGADAFLEIASWKDYPQLLDRCHFAVVSRPGSPAMAVRDAFPALADRMRDAPCSMDGRPGIFLVDAPTSPVSSTAIRHHVAMGDPLDGLVPGAVAAHIHRHGLYRGEESQGVS